MDTVVSAITGWKDLITKVFGAYPLAAALMTLAAVGAFYALEKNFRPKQAATNILIVLLGWAVAVPILGGVLWILGQAWDVVTAVTPALAKALASLFGIYERHPLLVLVLIAVAIALYFIWMRFRPNILPSRLLRMLVLAALVLVASHVASPIADMFKTKTSETPAKPAHSPSAPAASVSAALPTANPYPAASQPTQAAMSAPPASTPNTAAQAGASSTSSVPASAPK